MSTFAHDRTVTDTAVWSLHEAAHRVRSASVALSAAPDLASSSAVQSLVDPDDRRLLTASAAQIAECRVALAAAADRLESLADLTGVAGRAYDTAGTVVENAIEKLVEVVAFTVGRSILAAAVAAFSAATGITLGAGLLLLPVAGLLITRNPQLLASLAAHLPGGLQEAEAALQRVIAAAGRGVEALARALPPEFGKALQSPAASAVLGYLVEAAPALTAGVLGVPPSWLGQLEGAMGRDEMLAVLAGIGAAGARSAFGVGDVKATVQPRQSATPAPVSDPRTAMATLRSQSDQMLVHELRMPDGSRRFQVFIDGTQDFGLSDDTGLDGLANIENAVGAVDPNTGSTAAVAQALRDIGVTKADRIDLFAYSQGGHAAANLASSSEFNVSSVMTIGSPIGGADIPSDVRMLPIAQAGDHVPMTMGMGDSPTLASSVWDVVNGRDPRAGTPETVILEPVELTGSGVFARHDGEEYLNTLATAREESSVVDRFVTQTETELEGAVGVATTSVQLRREER